MSLSRNTHMQATHSTHRSKSTCAHNVFVYVCVYDCVRVCVCGSVCVSLCVCVALELWRNNSDNDTRNTWECSTHAPHVRTINLTPLSSGNPDIIELLPSALAPLSFWDGRVFLHKELQWTSKVCRWAWGTWLTYWVDKDGGRELTCIHISFHSIWLGDSIGCCILLNELLLLGCRDQTVLCHTGW